MKIMENSFADLEYEGKKSKMRRELFLERMQMLIPWGSPVGADQALLLQSWQGESLLSIRWSPCCQCIAAHPSTISVAPPWGMCPMNRRGEPDLEMQQTRKGNSGTAA